MNHPVETQKSEQAEAKQVFRVQGFTCANCAGKFEQNVKRLPGVIDAQVNFGASKITVYGQATVAELERAGAFEQLKVFPETPAGKTGGERDRSLDGTTAEADRNPPFYRRHAVRLTAALLLAFGIISIVVNGEGHLVTRLLFAASIIIGGFNLLKTGLNNLLRLEFDMRTLMTVAIIGAVVIGEWAEGAIVVILFAVSETLERFSMDKARQSIRSLMEIAPRNARIRREGRELTVPVAEIEIGDCMIVKPGQKIAMDGIVLQGASTVNQAAITGESVPVVKTVGDEVFAGTLNGEGLLEVRVTRRAEDTTLAKIIHLVEEAQAKRAPAQAFVDKFAKYYTPAIMAVAVLTAVVPPLVVGDWTKWLYQGLAVLVVGCPCALVISTPVAIVTAIGNAARHGVLIKGGNYLEALGTIRAIAFDKTGTLTKGVPVVTDFHLCDGGPKETDALAVVAALESRSQHPLAAAVLREAERRRVDFASLPVDGFSALTGKGITGTVDGIVYYVGSPELYRELPRFAGFSAEQERLIRDWQTQGKTVIAAGTETEPIALIGIRDEVREQAAEAVLALERLGIRHTVMLTGDNREAASAMAAQVGITDVRAELLPQDKLTAVHQLRSAHRSVGMVGDGVNDAPALAAATVGIAMGGSGTDTALETADVALMGDDLRKLPFAVRLSRKALAVIQQNIAFSLGIKLLALLLVVPGRLTLWIAILSDMGATLLVTLNGLRLLRVKDKP